MAVLRLPSDLPRLQVVMGVAGSGKSTVGKAWAGALGGYFAEGDRYHPQRNIDKMSRGIALDDADRWPWLESFARDMAARPGIVIGSCSALKAAYRRHIEAAAGEAVLFIYLAAPREVLWQRISSRQSHFMPASLLDSQLDTLEPPGRGECAVTVDVSGEPSTIVDAIYRSLPGHER